MFVLGADYLLSCGWGKPFDPPLGDLPAVPKRWALTLDSNESVGCPAVALFNVEELWVDVPANGESLVQFWKAVGTDSGQVAAVCDSSSGAGRSRRFQWEIAMLNAKVDDIAYSLAMRMDPRMLQPQQMTKELTVAGSMVLSCPFDTPKGLGSIPRPLQSGLRMPQPIKESVGMVDAPSAETSSHTIASQDSHLACPSALQAPRRSGRCPRASVAFLTGRVAGAIARMEGEFVDGDTR